jgi:BirA family biotin operon repressor/biotin-[acetyl-CoA-carboxylase] ligase
MASQNLCLEALFHYVVMHSELRLKKTIHHFNSTTHDVLQKLNELKAMGLPLTIDSEGVILNQSISPLDFEFIKSQCQNKIYYIFSTDSTNTLAKESTENAIFITEHQAQGRGQHGKSWITPLGQSIALSYSYLFDFSLADLSGINIAVGVAVMKTIKQFSTQDISLKWPNDIIGEFGKIAGILIEAQGSRYKCKACIGIGINWNISQRLLDSINQPCMNVEIESVNRSKLMVYLINELDNVIEEFKSNKLKNLISLWNEFDLLKNQIIHITEATDSYDATYLNVNSKGILQVKLGNEVRHVSSASIKIL